MITIILLIYLGIRICAPWWYFSLAGLVFLVKMAAFFVSVGKKVGEHVGD